jgi:hypothetical protein
MFVYFVVVKLREHPLMTAQGVPKWPPIWTQRPGTRTIQGEVGTLKNVYWYEKDCYKVFLVIDYDGELYDGALLLSDSRFCEFIARLLKQKIGLSLKDIGDLDVSYTV